MVTLRTCWALSKAAGSRSSRTFSSTCSRRAEGSAFDSINEILGQSMNRSSRTATATATATATSTDFPSPSQNPNSPAPSRAAKDRYGLLRNISPSSLRRGNVAGLKEAQERKDFEKMMTRRFREGDVYAPHDLTSAEAKKWKNPGRHQPVVAAGSLKGKKADILDMLNVNPLKEYKNFSIMSEYMTEMGRIKHSKISNLRPVNQRRMARAIRRAVAIGLMPAVHRHPLVLDRNLRNITK